MYALPNLYKANKKARKARVANGVVAAQVRSNAFSLSSSLLSCCACESVTVHVITVGAHVSHVLVSHVLWRSHIPIRAFTQAYLHAYRLRLNLLRISQRSWKLIILTMFLVFPSVCAQLASFFYCVEVDGIHYLKVAFIFVLFLSFMIFCLLLVVLLPLSQRSHDYSRYFLSLSFSNLLCCCCFRLSWFERAGSKTQGRHE